MSELNYNQLYYLKNKAKLDERANARNHVLSKEIICECGKKLKESNLSRHLSSVKHQKYLKTLECIECVNPDISDEGRSELKCKDLIFTDEELGYKPKDINEEIDKIEAFRIKQNAYMRGRYLKIKDNTKNTELPAVEYHKREDVKARRYERDHKIDQCVCGWVGIHASIPAHKKTKMHLNYLKSLI